MERDLCDASWSALVDGERERCLANLAAEVDRCIAATSSTALRALDEWSGELDDLLSGLCDLGQLAEITGELDLATRTLRHVIAVAAAHPEEPAALRQRVAASSQLCITLLARCEGAEGILLMKSLREELRTSWLIDGEDADGGGFAHHLLEVVEGRLEWAERETGWWDRDHQVTPSYLDEELRHPAVPSEWSGLEPNEAVLAGLAPPDEGVRLDVPRGASDGLDALFAATGSCWSAIYDGRHEDHDDRAEVAARDYGVAVARAGSLTASFPWCWMPEIVLAEALRGRARALVALGRCDEARRLAERASAGLHDAAARFPQVPRLRELEGYARWTEAWVRDAAGERDDALVDAYDAARRALQAACRDPSRQPENVVAQLRLSAHAALHVRRQHHYLAAARRTLETASLVRTLADQHLHYPGTDQLVGGGPRPIRSLQRHLVARAKSSQHSLTDLGAVPLEAPSPPRPALHRRLRRPLLVAGAALATLGALAVRVGLGRRSKG